MSKTMFSFERVKNNTYKIYMSPSEVYVMTVKLPEEFKKDIDIITMNNMVIKLGTKFIKKIKHDYAIAVVEAIKDLYLKENIRVLNEVKK